MSKSIINTDYVTFTGTPAALTAGRATSAIIIINEGFVTVLPDGSHSFLLSAGDILTLESAEELKTFLFMQTGTTVATATICFYE